MKKRPERLFLWLIHPPLPDLLLLKAPSGLNAGVFSGPALLSSSLLTRDTCTKLLLLQPFRVTFTDLYIHNKMLVAGTPKVAALLLHKFATNHTRSTFSQGGRRNIDFRLHSFHCFPNVP